MKIAIVDFDGTIIKKDSLMLIMLWHNLFLDKELIFHGADILLSKFFNKENELAGRSKFKKRLLQKINLIPKKKLKEYVLKLRRMVNYDVINHIKSGSYDKVIIASASEISIINAVICDILTYDKIIANDMHELENFATCYSTRKKELLLPDINYNDDLYVYTDSTSDKPLMDLAVCSYFIKKCKIYTRRRIGG